MNKEIKVSVIVPVYNVEKYLEKCLDSLVAQTLEEIEIIVVNDGSSDNSQKIIERYAEQYPDRFISLVKENGGLGDARNFGLKYAKGEYIGFVDSDDWIDQKMYESMYQFAINGVYDFVICDFTSIFDGWKTGWHSAGFRGGVSVPNKHDFMINCLDPATACNKLIHKSLFQIALFYTGWYEDIATTPILMSYANSIGYLPIQLYYYRQREGSIIQSKRDKRTLGVIDAWQRAMDMVKQEYYDDCVYAVYKSIVAFLQFKAEYADEFLEYFHRNTDVFLKNALISSNIKSGAVENLQKKRLIPKKLHYCWFGGNPKSELILKCIDSWKRLAPDFEIIEWNENNCDLHANKYIEQAYEQKKWAFVADYVRLQKVYEHGGIYVDTDTELMMDPSSLRLNNAFFAFETKGAIHAGIFGAVAEHSLIKQCRDSYQKSNFLNKDGTQNTSHTIVRRITDLLMNKGAVLNGLEQTLRDGTHIYPPNVLTLNMFDGKCFAQHHYDCSWWEVKEGVKSYKYTVLQDFFSKDPHIHSNDHSFGSELASAQLRIQQLENSTSWKITKPLRFFVDWLKRMLGGR